MLRRLNAWIIKKKAKKFKEERINQTKIDILEGKYPQISVKNPDVAEGIAKWNWKKENPVEFFLECLETMGITHNIELEASTKSEKDYVFVLREKSEEEIKKWKFSISQTAEEYLKLKNSKGEKISYYVSTAGKSYKVISEEPSNYIFKIKDSIVTIWFWKNKIQITVDRDITINITDYQLEINKNIYSNAKKLIEELKESNDYFDPYEYYCKVKKIISNYYNIQDATLEVKIMDHSCIKASHGKLIEYREAALGIIIKNYLDKDYREYRSAGIEVIWKDGYIKFPDKTHRDLQKDFEIAKSAIEKIENLEF